VRHRLQARVPEVRIVEEIAVRVHVLELQEAARIRRVDHPPVGPHGEPARVGDEVQRSGIRKVERGTAVSERSNGLELHGVWIDGAGRNFPTALGEVRIDRVFYR